MSTVFESSFDSFYGVPDVHTQGFATVVPGVYEPQQPIDAW
jgi:hypothetical protein